MQGIFRKENTDKALKYGIYRHLPTYEKIIRNLVSFYTSKNNAILRGMEDIKAFMSITMYLLFIVVLFFYRKNDKNITKNS